MRAAIALTIAMAGLTVAAYAQPNHVFIRHHGPAADIDSNHDGWLSRAEASAAADAMFAEIDANNDGRLTRDDHAAMEDEFNIEMAAPGAPGGGDCQTTVEPPNAREGEQRRVTVICNDEAADDHAGHGERRVVTRHAGGGDHVERTITIVRTNDSDDDAVAPTPPVPPVPPIPPAPPMAMMLIASSEEADTNGDGAMSREEFRAQQLRFFDASDVNGDGRVRFEPPVPPEPPTPPAPPEPPRHR